MNRDEFARMIQEHQVGLYRYMRYLGADEATAEDVVQDAFLAVLKDKNGPRSTKPQALAAWLRTIARNKLIDWSRKKKPIGLDTAGWDAAEATWCQSTHMTLSGDDEYIVGLRACRDKLSTKHRTILDMRYEEKLSRAEMAKALELGEEGVKSQLKRIRATLRRCIERRVGKSFC